MKKTILLNGIRYYSDRPANCRMCYFWKNRKAGCTLGKDNCYYLAESRKRKTRAKDAAMVPVSAFA